MFACGSKEPKATISDPETQPTQVSYDHKIISSKNGKRSYRFETPLLKRYELAKEPFMEFPNGIKLETFSDSSSVVESDLVADYAHFNERTQIWEARGNVVARNINESRWLYTELLYWDQSKKEIYTPEKAKVIDGQSVHYGHGFRADDSFEEWSFNKTRGQIEFDADTTSSQEIDSTRVDNSDGEYRRATASQGPPPAIGTKPSGLIEDPIEQMRYNRRKFDTSTPQGRMDSIANDRRMRRHKPQSRVE